MSPRSALRIIVAFALASVAVPALAHHDVANDPEVLPTWEAGTDGGMLSADVVRQAVASRSRNNSVESLFVSAVREKSDALKAVGVNDSDVVTTAFDTATGAVRWSSEFDAGLGLFDSPVGIALNYNNNLLHVVIDSGADSSIVTYAVSSGNESNVQALPGAKVNAAAISVSGSEMGVAGQLAGNFWFADYESGPQAITIDSSTVSGEAFDVAIHDKRWINSQGVTDWAPGDIDTWRTFVVTGRSGNFGSADVHTAAYRMDQTGHSPIWTHSWDGPDGNWDEGLAVETGYIRGSGDGVAWIAGRTRSTSFDWDIVVMALDLNTGAPLWTRTWGGNGGTEDAPVALWHAAATGTLYVTGTTDRGFPHGTDVVTLAYHETTGHLRGLAFNSGDVSNGDDAPTDVTATHDGDLVFVSAEILDLLPQGGTRRRAGVFAYDAALRPAGSGLFEVGGTGTDRSVGAFVDIDQTAVLIGGSSDPESSQRADLAGASFPLDDFEVLPEPGGGALAAGFVLLLGLARRRSPGGAR